MKPLVLTGYPIAYFNEENLGDLAVNFFLRFVWGQLPSTDELAAYLALGHPITARAAAITGRTLQVAGGAAPG
jgi:hypothetical protein